MRLLVLPVDENRSGSKNTIPIVIAAVLLLAFCDSLYGQKEYLHILNY